MNCENVSFEQEVWGRLSKIDVGEYINKKTISSSFVMLYLSWSDAWKVLMDNYPQSSFSFSDNVVMNDGSVEVRCSVTVRDTRFKSSDDLIGKCLEVTREMWLPVMDNKNNSVKNPDSRKISDAKMRCLVKCIAMFGLGLYIYSGEDLPFDDSIDSKISKENTDIINLYFSSFKDSKSRASSYIYSKYGRAIKIESMNNDQANDLIYVMQNRYNLNINKETSNEI
jgi:hypothetical protein